MTFSYKQLAEADERHKELARKLTDVRTEVYGPLNSMQRYHDYVISSFDDLPWSLAHHYTMESTKFFFALLAHVNSGAPLPRIIIDHSSHQPQQPAQPPTPQPVVSTYETLMAPSTSYATPRPTAPSTPCHWRSSRPSLGRPEATPVNLLPDPVSQDISQLDSYIHNVMYRNQKL